MPQAGFELMIPMFRRAKTVHALNSAAAMIGTHINIPEIKSKNTETDKHDKLAKTREITFVVLL
jgi:hypothetical protein